MKGSIATQIDEIEATIAEFEFQLDKIERSLRLDDLSATSRRSLKTEAADLKQQLDNQRSELRTLRKENLKSMLVSVIILAVAVAAYLTFGSQ